LPGPTALTGGRTNIWGRVSLRLSAINFEVASFDGYGEDWPLSYKDVAPHYDIVEPYVGVVGRAEGLPHPSDGRCFRCGSSRGPLIVFLVWYGLTAAIDISVSKVKWQI
jgi:choline dehydrogenase-like flavoprotein